MLCYVMYLDWGNNHSTSFSGLTFQVLSQYCKTCMSKDSFKVAYRLNHRIVY